MTIEEAIKSECQDCIVSSLNLSNTPENRAIFHVLGIVLMNIHLKMVSGDGKEQKS